MSTRQGNSSNGTGPLNRNAASGESNTPASARATNGSASNAGRGNSAKASDGNNNNNNGVWDTLKGWGADLSGKMGGRQTTIAVMVLAFVILVALIVYIVYKIRQRNLQSVVMINTPLKLYQMDKQHKFASSQIAPTTNGQEYTYSFWLYLVDYDTVSDTHRQIFLRNSDSSLADANPIVFMDGRTNRLYISVRTNQSVQVSSLDELLPENTPTSQYLTATLEYVPLQRWLFVSVVLQDNLMTVFNDGDMYTVKNVTDLWDSTSNNKRPFFKGTNGSVFVGASGANSSPTYGYISRLQFHNYALMESDVKALYAQGPTASGILSTMGLPSYGVRSPIYRLDGSGGSSGGNTTTTTTTTTSSG